MLESLTCNGWQNCIKQLQAQLYWSAVIEPEELAHCIGADEKALRGALAALGTRGLVGFDLDAGAYFYRKLPFDLSAVEQLQPRLKAARDLVAKGLVQIERQSSDSVEAFVISAGVTHRVLLGVEERCTWHAKYHKLKHRGDRGPCKHVLAVRIALEKTSIAI